MAAADGSPSRHQGQSWLSWSNNVGLILDEGSDLSEDEHNQSEGDSMKLRKEDMILFGFCPARDDFYLVDCELCGIVVKPQALRHHIDVRHGGQLKQSKSVINKTKLYGSVEHSKDIGNFKEKSKKNNTRESSPVVRVERMASNKNKHSVATLVTPSPQQPPPPPDPGEAANAKQEQPKTTAKSVVVSPLEQSSVVNDAHKERESFSSPNQIISNSKNVSSCIKIKSKIRDESNCKDKVCDNSVSKDKVSVNDNKSYDVNKNIENSKSIKKRNRNKNKERKLLLCKDREYDPNKHCGVFNVDTGKSCTRSLTCKTHPLSLRRAVPGRRMTFDELLNEHRASKEALLKAAQAGQSKHSSSPPKLIPPGAHNCKPVRPTSFTPISSSVSTAKSLSPGPPPLLRQCKTSSLSGSSSSSSPSKVMPNLLSTKESSQNIMSPQTTTTGGSCTSDVTSPDTASTSFHSFLYPSAPCDSSTDSCNIFRSKPPRPAAICTFGARRVGQGLFFFNRKQDIQRAVCKSLATERIVRPPSSKKLCLESRLPPVPDPNSSDDPSDPYSFSYGVSGEQIDKNSNKCVTNGISASPPLLSPSRYHNNSKSAFSPKSSCKSKNVGGNNFIEGASVHPSASVVGKPIVSRRKRSSSALSATVRDDSTVEPVSNEITVSIPESSANLAALPNIGLNPSALLKNHIDGSTTINSIKDLNIVVTNMDIINGQINNRLNESTSIDVIKSNSNRTLNSDNSHPMNICKQKQELSAKISKPKSKKPPILTKTPSNKSVGKNSSIISSNLNPVFASINSVSPVTNGIEFSSSLPIIQQKSSQHAKIFANHTIHNPVSVQVNSAVNKGLKKVNRNFKQLTNLNISQKLNLKQNVSPKPAQFFNLTQALTNADGGNAVISCDSSVVQPPVSTISYQQVYTNQVLGIGHLQLQSSVPKTNLSPTISIASPPIKIPYVRTSTPTVPSQTNQTIFLKTDATPRNDVQGLPTHHQLPS